MVGGVAAGFSMGSGAAIRNSKGIQLGKSPKKNHGRVDIGYGSSSNNKTIGGTLLNINNKKGASRFRIDVDSVNMLHIHYGKTNKLRSKHRTRLVRSIIGGITGAKKKKKRK